MNCLSKDLRSFVKKKKSNTEMVLLASQYLDRCSSRGRKKERLVWVNLPSIVEIFYAFDIIPFMPEAIGGFMSSLGYSMRALDKAYSMGYSRDACTFCNHVLGLTRDIAHRTQFIHGARHSLRLDVQRDRMVRATLDPAGQRQVLALRYHRVPR